MLIYWLLFAYFAIGALLACSIASGTRRPNVLFTLGAFFMIGLIGLRYKVGGDWLEYQFMYQHTGQVDLTRAITIGDPAYQAISWLCYQIGFDIWLVNIVCAAIFVWGLYRFSQSQRSPWLCVLVSVPYMVIVVAMGYTRQAAALGIIMAGIAAVIRGGSTLRFALYVIFAALFHKTAVIIFPIIAISSGRNRAVNLLIVITTGIFLYDAFLGNSMDHFVSAYIVARYSAQGAVIRVLMTAFSGALFFVLRRSLDFNEVERRIWRNFSISSIIALFLVIYIPSSAAVDRISLYLIPLQVAVFGNLPQGSKSPQFGTVVVATYCFAVEFVWLNFAQFAYLWVPYHFFPFSV